MDRTHDILNLQLYSKLNSTWTLYLLQQYSGLSRLGTNGRKSGGDFSVDDYKFYYLQENIEVNYHNKIYFY